MVDYYLNNYEHKVIFGDFNMNPVKLEMNTFLNTEGLTNLIKENTRFKAAGLCSDIILTNFKYSIHYSLSIETGLSDYHRLIILMIKTKLALEEPKRQRIVILTVLMVILKKSYRQSSILIARTKKFLMITLLMILMNMHLKNKTFYG